MDAETLYHQVGRLIQSMPALPSGSPLTDDDHLWLGRVDALLLETGDVSDSIDWRGAVLYLGGASHTVGLKGLKKVLYRVLGRAELKAPPGIRGAFIPAGNSFDTFAALSKVLQTAGQDILIIDPYLDETILTDFGGAIPARELLQRLPDHVPHQPTLEPTATAWSQPRGPARR